MIIRKRSLLLFIYSIVLSSPALAFEKNAIINISCDNGMASVNGSDPGELYTGDGAYYASGAYQIREKLTSKKGTLGWIVDYNPSDPFSSYLFVNVGNSHPIIAGTPALSGVFSKRANGDDLATFTYYYSTKKGPITASTEWSPSTSEGVSNISYPVVPYHGNTIDLSMEGNCEVTYQSYCSYLADLEGQVKSQETTINTNSGLYETIANFRSRITPSLEALASDIKLYKRRHRAVPNTEMDDYNTLLQENALLNEGDLAGAQALDSEYQSFLQQRRLIRGANSLVANLLTKNGCH